MVADASAAQLRTGDHPHLATNGATMAGPIVRTVSHPTDGEAAAADLLPYGETAPRALRDARDPRAPTDPLRVRLRAILQALTLPDA